MASSCDWQAPTLMGGAWYSRSPWCLPWPECYACPSGTRLIVVSFPYVIVTNNLHFKHKCTTDLPVCHGFWVWFLDGYIQPRRHALICLAKSIHALKQPSTTCSGVTTFRRSLRVLLSHWLHSIFDFAHFMMFSSSLGPWLFLIPLAAAPLCRCAYKTPDINWRFWAM